MRYLSNLGSIVIFVQNLGMSLRTLILSSICFVSALILFSLWLVSPYKYSWDKDLKQPNEDAIVVIRFCTIVIGILSIVFLTKHRRNQSFLNVFLFLILAFASYLFIQTYFL